MWATAFSFSWPCHQALCSACAHLTWVCWEWHGESSKRIILSHLGALYSVLSQQNLCFGPIPEVCSVCKTGEVSVLELCGHSHLHKCGIQESSSKTLKELFQSSFLDVPFSCEPPEQPPHSAPSWTAVISHRTLERDAVRMHWKHSPGNAGIQQTSHCSVLSSVFAVAARTKMEKSFCPVVCRSPNKCSGKNGMHVQILSDSRKWETPRWWRIEHSLASLNSICHSSGFEGVYGVYGGGTRPSEFSLFCLKETLHEELAI